MFGSGAEQRSIAKSSIVSGPLLKRRKTALHAQAQPGNPNNGQDLASVILAIERWLGELLERLHANAGFRRLDAPPHRTAIARSVGVIVLGCADDRRRRAAGVRRYVRDHCHLRHGRFGKHIEQHQLHQYS
jgi:hypothetical protein